MPLKQHIHLTVMGKQGAIYGHVLQSYILMKKY